VKVTSGIHKRKFTDGPLLLKILISHINIDSRSTINSIEQLCPILTST